MIKTKLILVDGITGSGKSTTAHFIARQMEKNGVKVKWYYEVEKDHPVFEILKNDDESDLDHSKRVFEEYPKKWIDFVNKVKDDEFVYIIESYLFQDVLMSPHFMNDLDRQVIKDYSHSILEIAKCLDPVLIHFYQKDVDKSLRGNWQRRDEEWTKWFIAREEKTLYCKNRNLKGEAGAIRLWQDFTDFTLEVFEEYEFRKIQFENSEHKWDEYKNQIMQFLELENFEEALYDNSMDQFCGDYIGKGSVYKVHIKNNRLCLDTFWPNLKLLPTGENRFEVEGFPVVLHFIKDDVTKVSSIKFSNSLCYDFRNDDEAIMYSLYNAKESDLEKYCGIYWCEADKLERKLYTKNGKFYYWREVGNESQLIPITDTQFMMVTMDDNRIEFKKVKGKWQFTFDIKGEKPAHHLFLPKVIYTSTRIIKDQYTDKEWQEYFKFNKECSELLKTEFHISKWEELKERTIQSLDCGLGIYLVKKDGKASGIFYFEKYFESHPELKHIYLWSNLGNNILDVEIIKLVLQAYLEFHPDHGFLVISSVNGLRDSLGEILHAKIVADQTHYELTKENVNREMIEEWLGTYPSRFPNLKIKFYEDIPENLLEEYCRVSAELLNDIPANSEIADYHITPDTLRLDQEGDRKKQRTSYRYLIFNEDNRLIAETKIAIDKKDPKIMIHHMTGVIKQCRGLGLSKWLKGAIYKKVEMDFPELEKITTHTHSDNLRLKSVSLQMGYKQTKTLKEFKITREKAEAFIKG